MVDWTQLDPFASGMKHCRRSEATDAPTSEPTFEPAATNAPVETSDPARVEPKSESQASAAPTAEPTTAAEPQTAPEPNEPNEPDASAAPDLATRSTLTVMQHGTGPRLAGALVHRRPGARGLDCRRRGRYVGLSHCVRVDLQTGTVDVDEPLLPPTLARRGFSLGESRVAWVAPPEATEGELASRPGARRGRWPAPAAGGAAGGRARLLIGRPVGTLRSG